ncbi:hypothetical protein Hanom_Chr11g01024481 [Helianthus anomalus]
MKVIVLISLRSWSITNLLPENMSSFLAFDGKILVHSMKKGVGVFQMSEINNHRHLPISDLFRPSPISTLNKHEYNQH